MTTVRTRVARALGLATAALMMFPLAASAAPDLRPPDATILSPTPGGQVDLASTLTGRATDDTGIARSAVAIRRLETGQWLQPDGSWGRFAWVGSTLDARGNWAFPWRAPAGGDYVVSAQAWDLAGRTDPTQQWVRFRVAATTRDTTSPTATVASPAVDEQMTSDVTVTGTARDDRGVTGVDVAIRDNGSGRWLRPDGSWGSFAWNAARIATPGASRTDWAFAVGALDAGSYGLLARASDAAGNRATSSWVRFSATAPAPPPSPTRQDWGVGSMTLDLVDASRSGRRVSTTVLYPSTPGTSGPSAPAAAGRFPVVVVGHGAGGDGPSAASLHRFLTDAGYVVAAPTFPKGFDFEGMAADVSFVIDQVIARGKASTGTLSGHIDAERIGYVGTSMGGMVGLTTYRGCCLDPRIDAVVAKIATAPTTLGWSSDTPLLMINGDADRTISYSSAVATYRQAAAPKGLITLRGVGHDLNLGRDGSLLHAAPLGFLDHYVRGDATGLDRVRRSVDGAAIASLEAAW